MWHMVSIQQILVVFIIFLCTSPKHRVVNVIYCSKWTSHLYVSSGRLQKSSY